MAQQNDDGTRSVELRIEVPGTQAEVWNAIATGHGISTWFTPTTLEERQGGTIHFDLAPGMESTGQVKTWLPNRKFEYEEADWMPGAPPLGTAFIIEPIAGGQCIVRLVQSLFTENTEWDDQLNGFESGWSAFLPILRAVLTHFRNGETCPLRLVGTSTKSEAETWSEIQADLGITLPKIGESVSLQAPDQSQLAGEVLSLGTSKSPGQILIRSEQPCPGLFYLGAHDIGQCVFVVVFIVSCGPNASLQSSQARSRWQSWLDQRFPTLTGPDNASHPSSTVCKGTN